ncbi:MAG: SusE domain-containing protein [Bacteroidota bacterium]
MKYLLQLVLGVCFSAFLFSSCDKADNLTISHNGTPVTLNASSTSIAPAPADSNSTALTLTWTSPNYATAGTNYKYIIEIDSTGRNFSKEYTRVLTGIANPDLTTSFTAKDLNAILLGYGFSFGVATTMDVRITSSYANNNEALKSNVIQIKMTAYKIPPKVAPPATGRLFIVGDATQGGWTNPVPMPLQELTKIDSVTYGGIFDLIGGKEYLILPLNGDWTNKFSVANKTLTGLNAGGDFGYNLSDNFPAPATSGRYQIIFDFQKGKFTVTPYTKVLPDSLYIVGDATPGGWDNPVTIPTQQFTRINSSKFSITLPLTGGKEYLMLPLNGNWDHKFAVADKTVAGLNAGGDFGYDKSDNFPSPAASGTYKIDADFLTYKFVVTKQ